MGTGSPQASGQAEAQRHLSRPRAAAPGTRKGRHLLDL